MIRKDFNTNVSCLMKTVFCSRMYIKTGRKRSQELLEKYKFHVTDLPVKAMIYRLDFPCFVGVLLPTFSTLLGQFSFGKTSGPTKKITGSDILPQMLSYRVRSSCISQENMVCYMGGKIMNCILLIRSYGLDQVIVIIDCWIKCFLFEKYF